MLGKARSLILYLTKRTGMPIARRRHHYIVPNQKNTLLKRDLVCVVDARKDDILILYLTGTLLKRDLVCVVDAREDDILILYLTERAGMPIARIQGVMDFAHWICFALLDIGGISGNMNVVFISSCVHFQQ
jgi:hypothetical protein